MNDATYNWYEARARVVKLMAHPTRLFIIKQLAEGEKCVHELTDMVGVDMSTVSKHLSLMKDAGIIAGDKRGNMVFYSLRMTCVLRVFECAEEMLKEQSKNHAQVLA